MWPKMKTTVCGKYVASCRICRRTYGNCPRRSRLPIRLIDAEDALMISFLRSQRQPYDMRKLVELIVDRNSIFEIQPAFGRALITSFARMNGKVVGIVASNPLQTIGGIVDYKAARKQGHFVELCDTFNIPLIFFVDIPGFMVGQESEANAVLREGVRARYIGLQVTVPVFTVIVRKCYGMAGGGAIDRRGLNFKIAWPSAEWGSLPLEGGVKAAYRREIDSAADPAQREKEIEAELRQVASPFRTAEAFAVEDLIDPRRDTPLFVPVHRCCPDTARNTARP